MKTTIDMSIIYPDPTSVCRLPLRLELNELHVYNSIVVTFTILSGVSLHQLEVYGLENIGPKHLDFLDV